MSPTKKHSKEEKPERIIREIKSLKIQGARVITISALRTLLNYVERNGFDAGFDDLANLFSEIRPTQASLFNAMELIKKHRNARTIQRLIDYFESVDDIIARKWFDIINDGDIIATHCHSSEEMALLKEARKNGIKFEVIVTETRPKLQGIKSAKELSQAGIKVKYIVDSAVCFFSDEITKFVFGCDSIRREGVYNKIGTCMMAMCAREMNLPVYFVGDVLKIDERKDVVVEMRDPREVINPNMLGKKVEVLNPAFDCTPWNYITQILTDKGKASTWETIRKMKLKMV